MASEKTVLILGAGFSKSKNLPLQSDILKAVDHYYTHVSHTSKNAADWKKFKEFFINVIGNNINEFLIEDIFTIFDKCIADNEQFKGISVNEINDANASLLKALRAFFTDHIEKDLKSKGDSYRHYLELANRILKLRRSFAQDDRLSLISLNWDCYFEKILTIALGKPEYHNIELDYCTYDYNFSTKPSNPSINKKAKGKINLKILKPHGSTNWGYCSNCGRLYISYGKKIYTKYECIKYCNKKYGTVQLSPVMITPTFLKELSNYHLRNIWNNIQVELSEARRIIFIGYSLRPEDYFFRFALSKNIDHDTRIFVIDWFDGNKISKEKEEFKTFLNSKFRKFFQKNPISEIFIDGWEANISNISSIIRSGGYTPHIFY